MTSTKRYNAAGWLLFSVILLINLWYHGMWFDELQAWSLTRSHSGIIGLLTSGEGHPVLWYILIWPLTKLSANPDTLKLVTGLLGIGSLGLLWTRSPFSLAEKALICLGYQFGFNLSVLSRSYCPGTFLAFLFLALMPRYRDRPWLGWLVLGLLANTHFFFTLVSFCLGMLWLHSARNPKLVLRGVSLYVAGVAFCAFCLFGQGTGRTLRGTPVAESLNAIGSGFLPISYPFNVYYWNTRASATVGITFALVSLLTFLVLFRKYPLAQGLVLFQTTFLALFFTFAHPGQSWHVGVIFVSVLLTVWFCRIKKREVGPSWLFLLILLIQALFGTKAMIASKMIPVAGNRTTAELIRQLDLQESFLVGYPQFPTTAVGAYLDKPMYFLEKQAPLLYCDWDGPWISVDRLVSGLQTELKKRGSPGYLVLPTHQEVELLEETEKTPISIEKIGATHGSMVEHYVILRLELSDV
jgi:hypothetical protein